MKSRAQYRGVISSYFRKNAVGHIQMPGASVFFHHNDCVGGLEEFKKLRKGRPVEFDIELTDKGTRRAVNVAYLHSRVEYLAPTSFVFSAEREPKFGKLFGSCFVAIRNDESPVEAHDALQLKAEEMGFNAAMERRCRPQQTTGNDGQPYKFWIISAYLGLVYIPHPESQDTITREEIDAQLEVAETNHAYFQAHQIKPTEGLS